MYEKYQAEHLMNNGETMNSKTRLNIRKACENDSKELCSIINEIIEIGGTTVFENELGESEFESCFLNGTNYICYFLVNARQSNLELDKRSSPYVLSK